MKENISKSLHEAKKKTCWKFLRMSYHQQQSVHPFDVDAE